MPIKIGDYTGVKVTERMWRKVAKPDGEDGCWEWLGYRDQSGYGRVRVANHGARLVHRVFFVALAGAVSDALELDHLCRNRACVNPAHMEPVTHQENVRRGLVGERERAKTHCRNGHPYAGANLRKGPYGRACRTCNNEACRRYRARRKERAA